MTKVIRLNNIYISVIVIIALCIIVNLFVINTNITFVEEQYKISSKINEMLSELEQLSQENVDLKKTIETYFNNVEDFSQETHSSPDKYDQDLHSTDVQPSTEYEELRRGVRQNVEEMCNYFSFELKKIQKTLRLKNEENQQKLDLIGEYKQLLISDFEQMRLIDGYESWRQKEADDLSNLVQTRLSYIQNPVDCKNAKKLICDMEMNVGFGCVLHHIAHCLIGAYALERTMVLNSKNWTYNVGGWEEIFQPVSQTCTEYNRTEAENWPGSTNSKLLLYPRIFDIRPRPQFLPLSVPKDLVPRIKKLHGDPSVWWISQFVKYLFKVKNGKWEETIKKNLNWKKPIVGVHIRRTDKVNHEASFYRVEEYMEHVENYYQTLNMNKTEVERSIFLATDDPNVVKEIHTKYPQYKIINTDGAEHGDSSKRYTHLNGILSDILMLSLSDYIVCTFSSNVCRLAYQLMQNHYHDASNRFKSLDYIYFFGGQRPHEHEAILAHKSRNIEEININPGDLIHVYNNLGNGFFLGKNTRTLKVGLFPIFKVKHKIRTIELVKLPNYVKAELVA